MYRQGLAIAIVAVGSLLASDSRAFAGGSATDGRTSIGSVPNLLLGFAGLQEEPKEEQQPNGTKENADDTENGKEEECENALAMYSYREVSDFFNVREANSSVEQGEWELEFETGWETGAGEGDDDAFIGTNLKYGITDDIFVELELLPLNLGDGGDQGNGDLALVLFWQFLHETEVLPAMATWAEIRIPSGQGSSGVDGEVHLNLTKSITPELRAHVEGWAETANGGRGDEDVNRRDFQWGLGTGFDYQFDEKTIGVLNYLNRSSEENGYSNENILELGMVREIVKGQHLKLAVDIGLDGQEETPEFGVRIQYAFEF